MQQILISGHNKISDFLFEALSDKGFEPIDISGENLSEIHIASPKAIIDINYASDEHLEGLSYSIADTQILLELSKRLNIPYLFIYKESVLENETVDALDSLDLINRNILDKKVAKIMIDEIYGQHLNTCQIIDAFIKDAANVQTIVVKNDIREYFLLEESDFISGLLSLIENKEQSKYPYTLIPEDSITEIELANFFIELSDLLVEIVFEKDDEIVSSDLAGLKTNYPNGWYPQIDLETGLKKVMTFYGIPLIGTGVEETTENSFRMRTEHPDEYDDEENDFYHDNEEEPVDYPYSNFDTITEKNEPTNIKPQKKAKKPKKVKLTEEKPAKFQPSKKKMATVFAALALIIGVQIATSSIQFQKGIINQQASLSAFDKFDFYNAAKLSSTAASQFQATQNILLIPGQLFLKNKQSENEFYQKSNQTLNKIASRLSNQPEYTKNEKSAVLGDRTTNLDIENAINELDFIQAESQNTEKTDALKNQIKETLTKNKLNLKNLIEIADSKDELLGFNEPKNYIFVLTNNSEFVGNFPKPEEYYSVEIDQGEIKSIQKMSLDKVAEQAILNGEVQTKEDLYKNITDTLDINSATKKLENYIINNENTKFDGYFFVNKDFIKNIKMNTFEETLRYFMASTNNDFYKNFKLFADAANSKQIIISTDNQDLRSITANNGWDGQISKDSDDYLSVSVIPQNGLIRPKVTIKYVINPPQNQVITRELEVNLENKQNENIQYRFSALLPKDVIINDASILENNEEKSILKNLSATIDNNKTLVMTELLAEANRNTVIRIKYESLAPTDKTSLSGIIQKQPGTNDTLQVIYDYQRGLPPTFSGQNSLTSNNNTLEFYGTFEKDLNFELPL